MMHDMRTTVTLDDDTAALVQRRMRERGISFKEAINEAIRAGLVDDERPCFRTETSSMGRSRVPLDRALQLAADLEDDELLRRMRTGS